MDVRSGERQLWLRLLLALGIMWGFVPLITVMFVFRGAKDSTFDAFATVFNSLTILPACILAFWHRRTACVWLTINGAFLVGAFAPRVRELDKGAVVTLMGSVLIAICLDFTELKHWPSPLDR